VESEEEEELVTRLRAGLEKYSPALGEGLRAAMTERTFPPHPMFKGARIRGTNVEITPPRLGDADALCGIHVMTFHPGWHVAIGGLSRAAACKCGVRIPFDRRAEDPWDDDPDGALVLRAVERWVIEAWRAVRAVAPDLRGFMSEHDGGKIVDLDSGQVVPQMGMGSL
jgi:hypothetical protein